jgi:hypothetical protein
MRHQASFHCRLTDPVSILICFILAYFAFCIATNFRNIVQTFGYKTLVLVKLFLLDKRIVFYCDCNEYLTHLLYSLSSLVPGK